MISIALAFFNLLYQAVGSAMSMISVRAKFIVDLRINPLSFPTILFYGVYELVFMNDMEFLDSTDLDLVL